MIASPDGAHANWPFMGSIYGVSERGSSEVRYVGLTTKLVSRRRIEHWKSAEAGRRTPFADWLRSRRGREVVVFRSLEVIMGTELSELGNAEQRWISHFRASGHRLLNVTDGGLGPRGYVWTVEQRAAASLRSKGRKHPNPLRGEDNPMWGRRHSDEQKAIWSELRRGSITGEKNPNWNRRGADHPSFGRTWTDEQRERLSASRRGEKNPNFGKTASEETRAKMSAARRGRPMPSSVRSAHTRHHTNKGIVSETCRHCRDDQLNSNSEE